MKKRIYKTKLALNKETIASLNPPEMDSAVGGTSVWSFNPNDMTCNVFTCVGDPEKGEGLCVAPWVP